MKAQTCVTDCFSGTWKINQYYDRAVNKMRSLDCSEWLSILIVFEGLQPLPSGKLSVIRVSELDGGGKDKDHVITLPGYQDQRWRRSEFVSMCVCVCTCMCASVCAHMQHAHVCITSWLWVNSLIPPMLLFEAVSLTKHEPHWLFKQLLFNLFIGQKCWFGLPLMIMLKLFDILADLAS